MEHHSHWTGLQALWAPIWASIHQIFWNYMAVEVLNYISPIADVSSVWPSALVSSGNSGFSSKQKQDTTLPKSQDGFNAENILPQRIQFLCSSAPQDHVSIDFTCCINGVIFTIWLIKCLENKITRLFNSCRNCGGIFAAARRSLWLAARKLVVNRCYLMNLNICSFQLMFCCAKKCSNREQEEMVH